MKKKIFAIIVVVVMLVAMFPLTAMAEGTAPQPVMDYFSELKSNGLEFDYIVKPSPMTSVRNLLVDWVKQANEELNKRWTGFGSISDVTVDENSDHITIAYHYVDGLQSGEFTAEKIPVTFFNDADSTIVAKIDKIIDNAYKKSMTGTGEGFRLEDIDIIKFALDGYIIGNGYDNSRNYCSAYRKATLNANFELKEIHTGGMGGPGSPFFVNDTESTLFYYKNLRYRVADSNLIYSKMLYVPENTAKTPEAYIAAAKARIKAATDVDVKIEKKYDSLEAYYYAENPAAAQVPYSTFVESWKIYVENWDKVLDAYFEVTIGDNVYPFLISCDEKYMSDNVFTTADIATDISISTEDKTVSKDSQIAVDEVSKSENDKLLKKIGLKDGESFDISIGNADGNITKLANGKFLVSIPVPAELEGKTLSAYYVTAAGKVEEHPATVKNGFATFETDHFSVYTLGEANKVPATADNSDSQIWITLLLLSLVAATYIVKRKNILEK